MALENVITSLVLDVIDHDQTQGVVKAIALDSKTRYVKATLVQHGIDYPVDENATVTLTILRPDNVGVQVTGSVVDVDNADRTGTIKGVYAELTQAALAKSGTLRAQFKITSGEQILRTEIFAVKNGVALDGETSEWADQYEGYNLDELVQSVNEMETDVSELKSGLNQYFFDKRYNVYNGKLKQTGVYWNENGGLNESGTWGITDYMSIKYGKMYYKGLVTMGTKTKAIFVDANYNFISAFRPQPYLDGREVALDSIVEIPDNAEYISFSLAVSQYSAFQFLFDPNEYLQSAINNLSEHITQIEDKPFNNVLVGNDNMMWSWWLYPQAFSLNRVRHKLYYGYVTSDGYKGVAEYDFDSQTVVKNNIIKAGVDDHNALAVYAFSSGRIVCAYSTGHNEDNKIRVRRSTSYESVAEFGEEIILESVGLTSYAQMCYSNDRLYLFYRTGTKNWAYRTSTDEGITWSNEVILITSGIQYYCMFRPTNTANVLRVLMYSNPALGEDTDTNIRQAFLHTDNNTLYDSDNSTVLGASNINKDNVTILISNETGTLNRQRLFDCAVTDVDKPLVLYAPFHMNNDSAYKLYDAGTVVQICGGGADIAYTYQMGACFNGVNEIIVARGSGVDGGTDFIEKYAYNDGALGTPSVIYSEVRGNIPIRNFRPIADINGDAIMWVRGYYNSATYNDYDTDAKLNVLI